MVTSLLILPPTHTHTRVYSQPRPLWCSQRPNSALESLVNHKSLLLSPRSYNQRPPFPEQAHVLPLSNELDNPNSNSSLPCTQTYLPGLEGTWADTGENNGALAGGTMLSGCHQNRASTCFPFCGAYELVPVYSTRRCKR